MGKGIAKEYKERFPDMYHRYIELCGLGLIRPGKLWLFKTDEKWVLNFPTKDHWRNPSQISYLEQGLQKFMKTYKDRGIESIAFPLLGANNGGLSPKTSLEIMSSFLNTCEIPVEIYINYQSRDLFNY